MTVGAVELRKHIDALGVSVPKFCEDHALERIAVQRLLNGERERIGLAICLAIEKATDGAVAAALWNDLVADTLDDVTS